MTNEQIKSSQAEYIIRTERRKRNRFAVITVAVVLGIVAITAVTGQLPGIASLFGGK